MMQNTKRAFKITAALLGMILPGGLAVAQAMPAMHVELPPVTQVGEKGLESAEFIYALDDRPTTSCHAATLAETDKGIVAAWFGGTRERNPDVTIWVSRKDKGGEWTKPMEAGDGIQPDGTRQPCWNPVLFQPKTGPLMLFFKVGPTPRDWWGMMTTSEDGGATWATPHRMGEDPAIGHLLGPVKNKPIQLADGAILCPSSTEGGGWRVHFERSDDMGKTWQVIGPIPDGGGHSAIQPSILTYPDGKMQIVCRSKDSALMQSWSSDGGKTWSPLNPMPLPNPSSGTDAVTLQDGRQLLVYNHTTTLQLGPNAPASDRAIIKGRYMLNVATSKDGAAWTTILTLDKDQGGNAGYSYPAVIQTSDGMIHIAYTWRRETIKHVVLDPAKLPGPKP